MERIETRTINRKIIHVDMDAFYASVEQRDDPSLRGLPVVVAWKGKRSVVCAASYEAREFGIRSAMPAIRAERLCPDAKFVPPDFERYKEVSARVKSIYARYTDLIEPLSLDEAYLDVTDNARFTSATQIAKEIRAAIHDELSLTASAGVSFNKFLAKIASDWKKPNGLFVITPLRANEFLEPLPIGRLPGVGKVGESRLAALGVITVDDLRRLEIDFLESTFGKWGRRLYELARGIDNSPVQPDRPSTQISSEDTFPDDLMIDQVRTHVERLASSTWAAYLREANRFHSIAVRTISIKLKTADFRIITRSKTYSSPITDLNEFVLAAKDLLDRVDAPKDQRFRLLGVGMSGISRDAPVQKTLFDLGGTTNPGRAPG